MFHLYKLVVFWNKLAMKIGYARISTNGQHLDLQIDALKKAGCEKIYKDIISGSLSNRPALDQLLNDGEFPVMPV
jgi:DNA invertase Pin-like site-specific DNA recombinase